MKLNALRPLHVLNKEINRQAKEWKTLENKMFFLAYIDFLLHYIRKERLDPEQRISLVSKSKKLKARIQYVSGIQEKPIAVIEIETGRIRLYVTFPTKDNSNKSVHVFLSEYYGRSDWMTKFDINLGKKVYYEILGETRDKEPGIETLHVQPL